MTALYPGRHTRLLIASQQDEAFRSALQVSVSQALPDVCIEICELHPDDVSLLSKADILLTSARGWPASMPQGWPYQIRWIQLFSTGIDQYPEWLTESTLPVTNLRGAVAGSITEYVLAALFRQHKQLAERQIQTPDAWRPDNIPQLAGTTLGIVGYGAIGQQLTRAALALGLRVVVLRRHAVPIPDVELASDIHALIRQVDHLVLAAPATSETRHLMNAEVFRAARPGLHLINIARGTLIDQDALLNALNDGHLGHATLDVTEPEPLPTGHPLYTHPRVTLTPHTSSTSVDVYPRVLGQIVENLQRWLTHQPLLNQIDARQGY